MLQNRRSKIFIIHYFFKTSYRTRIETFQRDREVNELRKVVQTVRFPLDGLQILMIRKHENNKETWRQETQ